MSRVFVCLNAADGAAWPDLAAQLRRAGHEPWLSASEATDQVWWTKAVRHTETCDVFVALLSSSFVHDATCDTLLTYAVRLGIPVVPVRVRLDVDPRALPAHLREVHVIDGTEPARLPLLLRSIEASAARRATAPQPPSLSPWPPPTLSPSPDRPARPEGLGAPPRFSTPHLVVLFGLGLFPIAGFAVVAGTYLANRRNPVRATQMNAVLVVSAIYQVIQLTLMLGRPR